MKTTRRGLFGMLAGLAAFGKVPRSGPGADVGIVGNPALPFRSGSWVRTLDWNEWRAHLAQLREGRA